MYIKSKPKIRTFYNNFLDANEIAGNCLSKLRLLSMRNNINKFKQTENTMIHHQVHNNTAKF